LPRGDGYPLDRPSPAPLVSPTLESNWNAVRRRIDAAAARAGRAAGEVALLAVTKEVGPEVAAALAALGQADLGESRADELERKATALRARGLAPRWHFVGHLQRNKARRVVRVADEVHSVDDPELLAALARVAAEEGRRPRVWLQVKLWPEPAKSGFAPGEVRAAVLAARSLPSLELAGVMAIAPLLPPGAAEPAAREVFGSLAALARELSRDPETARAFTGGRARTSMGMSGDLEVAVEQGSDLVRVGGALYQGLDARDLAAPSSREAGG